MHLALAIHEDVHLAPNPELPFEVNSRLDREARPSQDEPLVVRFEVVHVGPVAVRLLADAVPGPMNELISISGLDDHRPRRVVHLESPDRTTGRERRPHRVDRCIASLGDSLENLFILLRHSLADEPDPRQVAIDRFRPIHLGPEVDQDEVPLPDRRIVLRRVLEMRIAAVRADAHDRRTVRRHARLAEVLENRGLDLAFRDRLPGSHPIGDQPPGQVERRAGVAVGLQVHRPLIVIPGRLEKLNQIA